MLSQAEYEARITQIEVELLNLFHSMPKGTWEALGRFARSCAALADYYTQEGMETP